MRLDPHVAIGAVATIPLHLIVVQSRVAIGACCRRRPLPGVARTLLVKADFVISLVYGEFVAHFALIELALLVVPFLLALRYRALSLPLGRPTVVFLSVVLTVLLASLSIGLWDLLVVPRLVLLLLLLLRFLLLAGQLTILVLLIIVHLDLGLFR